jgi:RNA 2',3'-cyclic 3'-phosphodiesterase
MPDMRLFIAADLTLETKAALGKLIENLQKGINFTKAYPTWCKPGAIHLTLKFLGNVDDKRVPEIAAAVGANIEGVTPFNIKIQGLGVFPNEREPHVLWIGLKQGEKELVQLQKSVEEALVPLGFPRENRPFHPHLTLARIKSTRGIEPMMDVVHSHRNHEVGEVMLDHVSFYQSILRNEGPIYKVLHRWDFIEKQMAMGN